MFSHLSGFTEKKGVIDLVDAFGIALRRGLDAELHLGGDGPTRTAAEDRVRALDLAERVFFHGYVPPEARARFLRLGQIFVHPSRTNYLGGTEGIPNAIKEAMALGLPVVSTYNGGIPELVRDGATGWLAPQGDPEALASALGASAAAADRWGAMGRQGRLRVERHFSLAGEISALLDLYRELLSDRHNRTGPTRP